MWTVSASGGGHTQFVLTMISKMENTFGHIYLVYKAVEPLYHFSQQTIGADKITLYTQLSKFSPLPDLPKVKHLLVIKCVAYP